jgi:hypothetical protein
MRNLLARLLAAGVLSLALGGMAVAQTDPTVHQIYEAAASGHLDQAQQMIDQVLRDHPDSAKAHYVQSELYAREGKFGLARAELDRAEQLAPGLPKEDPRSVAALKSELARAGRAAPPFGVAQAPAHHFPWGVVLILALGAGVFWMLLSRRRTSAPYPSSGTPTAAAGPYGPGYGPGGPGAPLGGGGIGSAVAGGLAGGLAAGAGIVAGEEIARRLLGGEHPSAPPDPVADGSELSAGNRDMGGSDFGVNDPGTWDDNSGGGSWSDNSGGGGGDDWT